MAKRPTRTRPGRRADVTDDMEEGPVRGNDEVATKAWKCWRDTRNHLQGWRQEAAESYDIVAGHQWTNDEEAALKEQLRPVVTFNRTGVVLDSVSGYEINSRQDVAYLPRQVGETGPVQVEGEAAKYFRQQCDAEDEESDAFTDVLAVGLGWVEHRMDYDDDPEGMLKVERVDPLEMGYDPAATKRNLADRRWDIRGKWWEKEVAEATFPEHDFDSADNIVGDLDDINERQPIDRRAAAFYKDTGVGDQSDRRKNKVFILEHTWFEREKFVTALNPMSQQMEDVEPKKLKAVNDQLAARGQPPLRSMTRTRKAFKRAFVHGRDTLNPEDLAAPCPEKFHYQPMTGKRDRNKNIWYGLVRPMKDPQRWANKFMSQTMHMVNANAKGGIIHDEGAFENADDVEKRLAKPGWRIAKRQGFNVEFVPPSTIPTNTFELMQFAIGSVRDTTGVNVELLGLADRDQPGVLEHSRKQSAMAILAPFFDAMRRYRKEAGRLTLYFIHEYLSDGRLIRITGPEGAQYIPLTKKEGFDKYDVVVDQAPTSPNAKLAVFGILMQVLPALMKAGVPIPPDLLDYVPDLPAELSQKWKSLLQKPNPQRDKAQELEAAEKIADIDKTAADAELSRAKAGATNMDMVAQLTQIAASVQQLMQAFSTGAMPPGMQPPVPGNPNSVSGNPNSVMPAPALPMPMPPPAAPMQ